MPRFPGVANNNRLQPRFFRSIWLEGKDLPSQTQRALPIFGQVYSKACGLVNIEGFYDGLLAFLDRATEEKFIRSEHRMIVLSDEDPVELIEKLAQFEVPSVPKWID